MSIRYNNNNYSDIQSHPKRQRQMLLTPSVSNRSRVPSQVATSDIQFDLKHVKIQPVIVNYYGKQLYNNKKTNQLDSLPRQR